MTTSDGTDGFTRRDGTPLSAHLGPCLEGPPDEQPILGQDLIDAVADYTRLDFDGIDVRTRALVEALATSAREWISADDPFQVSALAERAIVQRTGNALLALWADEETVDVRMTPSQSQRIRDWITALLEIDAGENMPEAEAAELLALLPSTKEAS